MKRENSSVLMWKKISWTAIFSGVLTGFGINFLLNLTALALGISIFTLTTEGKMLFSFLGFIFFAVISICTMFITGWVAGRLSPPLFYNRLWGALIGFISWTMLLIVTVVIITNMIQFVAFHSNFTSHPNLVAIKIANDAPMMTETKESTLNPPLDINIEKTTKVITLNAFVTLGLFILGALSSCTGGYIGYNFNRKNLLNNKRRL